MDIQPLSPISAVRKPKKIYKEEGQEKKKKQPLTPKPQSKKIQDDESDVQHIDERV